ncbi:enoyl-CoA hydratase/isomerase family protein [Streptomyces sp. NPDC102279]|uniref:enoyl-CoA hydratase/isomerase family protein n=1 Tax=Streptomyces sp. NPDC102279 TaxID=3366153 RepID=UPI003812D4EA
MADLEYTVDQGVATIRLNRPKQKNAFTMAMIDDWVRLLVEARTDDDVRVVVLTGAPGAFCAGGDLDALGVDDSPLGRKNGLMDNIHRIPLALEDLDKPVIAAVNGVAVGAGMDMALMCDIRLVARSARFSEGYIKVGLVPGDGGCYYLPRLVGMAKALELMWTGDFIDADEALRLGIANHVYDDDTFEKEAFDFARRIAQQSQIHVRMIKRATQQSARSDLRTALDLISSHMSVARSTHDSAEAMTAFREKRKPKFQGR